MSSSTRVLQRSVFLNGLFIVEGGAMFLLDIVLAASLGLGLHSDSLYAAWGLPQTIGRGMFQSLTNSFMGMFKDEGNTELAYRQAISVIGVLAIVMAGILSLTAIWWFPLSVIGSDAQTRQSGIVLAAILAWLIALLGPAETFRAIYYRANHLVIPSLGRILGVLVSIVVAIIGSGKDDLLLVAWGLVAGALVEAVIGMIGLYLFLDFNFRFAWPDSKTLRNMTRVFGLPLLGQGIRVVTGVIERALASFLGPGALTAVSFATRILTTLDRFVFRGFLVATIQTFTAGETDDYNSRLRLIGLLAVPIGVVFALYSPEIIGIAYGRGRFTAEDVQKVSLTLQAYAPAILALALSSIPLGLAYARQESRAVMIFFAMSSILLVVIEVALLALGLGLELFGIALTLATIISLIWLGRYVAENNLLWSRHDTLVFVFLVILVLAGTSIVRQVSQKLFSGQWMSLIALLAGGIAAVLLTGLVAKLLRLKELEQITRIVRWRYRPTNG